MQEVTGTGPQCGTLSGRQRHSRAGTTPCEPCKQASRDYDKARRRRIAAGYLITLAEAYELVGLPRDRTAEAAEAVA